MTSWKSEVHAPQGYRTIDSCWLGHGWVMRLMLAGTWMGYETDAGWDMDGLWDSCWLGHGMGYETDAG